MGGARCRTVGAHAVHNALTQLNSLKKSLHGEKVGFGVLVQLKLEESLGFNHLAGQARKQLIAAYRKFNLPSSLADLGYGNLELKQLQEVCTFVCRECPEIHYLPFEIKEEALLEALIGADSQLSTLLSIHNGESKVT